MTDGPRLDRRGIRGRQEAAPAKVNLYLHVTGRRADGYHLLDSLVVFAGAGDRRGWRRRTALSLARRRAVRRGAGGRGGQPGAARRPRAGGRRPASRRGAALRLDKRLPVASGIGGGSADAAAALRALDALWGLRLGAARLAAIAARLGADVPVCVASRAAAHAGHRRGRCAAPRPCRASACCWPIRAWRWRRRRCSGRARGGFTAAAPPCPPAGRTPRPWPATWLRPPATTWRRRRSALCPPVARGAGGAARAAGLPAGADERQRRHLLRDLRDEAAAAAAGAACRAWWRWGGGLAAR